MARSLVLQVVFVGALATVAAVVLAVDAPAGASGSVTVSGEYVEYENFDGWPSIGPFVDLRELFHAASLGPAGVACSADTVTIMQNEVAFTFDPEGGPVIGIGLLELSCEYHPGCGAVTRVIEASYRGSYDEVRKLMTGAVDFTTLDGESTNWGNPTEENHCLERWVKPGESAAALWVLDLDEATPNGYITSSIEGDDPRKRFGFITVSAPVTTELSDSGPLTGGSDEPSIEGDAGSADAAGKSGEETIDTDAGLPIGSIILAVALVLGVGAAILLIRHLLGHGKAPLEQAARERAVRASAQADQEAAQAGSAWFKEQATHVIEAGQVVYVVNPKNVEQARAEGKEIPPGMDASLPLSLEPLPGDPAHPDEEGPIIRAVVRDGVTVVYDPDHPDIAVLRTGAQIWVQPEQLTALPSDEFVPTHELIGTGHIEGRATDKVFAYQAGTPVQVVTTTGDQTLVRVNDGTEVWVPRSNVGPATAQIDEPS